MAIAVSQRAGLPGAGVAAGSFPAGFDRPIHVRTAIFRGCDWRDESSPQPDRAGGIRLSVAPRFVVRAARGGAGGFILFGLLFRLLCDSGVAGSAPERAPREPVRDRTR